MPTYSESQPILKGTKTTPTPKKVESKPVMKRTKDRPRIFGKDMPNH